MTIGRRGSLELNRWGVLAFGLSVAACNGGAMTGTDASMSDIQTTDSGTPTDSGVDVARVDTGSRTDAMSGTDAAHPGHDFASAVPISVNAMPMSGTLVDPATQDYYSFTANAGDRLVIIAPAQSLVTGGTGNDATVIDTVVTVFNSSMVQIAQDDDAHPRESTDATLYFEAPATGTYYVAVGDCNGAIGTTANCAPAAGITTFDYQVAVIQTSMTGFPEANAASTQDGTTAHAQAIMYRMAAGGMAGQYGSYIIDGNFAATTSTHVYSFTPPADVLVTAGARPHALFWVQPIGAHNGDGSTSNVLAWVTDSTGTTILARADENNYRDGDNATNGPLEISVPVTLGQQYYLFVQNTATASAPTTDYYFIQHSVGTYYYGSVEAEGPTGSSMNDAYTAAQALTTPSGVTAGAYFADGDLSSATDVDWYRVAVPASATNGAFGCVAARNGSGTQGFTAALFGSDGTTMLGSALGPEASAPMIDLNSPMITIAAGTTTAYLRVSATGQSSTVTGTSYRCNLNFQ